MSWVKQSNKSNTFKFNDNLEDFIRLSLIGAELSDEYVDNIVVNVFEYTDMFKRETPLSMNPSLKKEDTSTIPFIRHVLYHKLTEQYIHSDPLAFLVGLYVIYVSACIYLLSEYDESVSKLFDLFEIDSRLDRKDPLYSALDRTLNTLVNNWGKEL